MIKFGLVGYGAWGQQHEWAIRNHPEAELSFILSSSMKKSNHTAGVPVYDDLDVALAQHAIDVLDVVVPNHLHAHYAKIGLSKGLHVLLEKPIATSTKDAETIIKSWEASGNLLYVGYELRLSTLWKRVKELVRSGAIGQLLWIDVSLERHPFRQGKGAWRYQAELVGNWMIEEAVHHIDLITWLTDTNIQPQSIDTIFPGGNLAMSEHCSTTLHFPSGMLATYRYCLIAEGHHLIVTIYGEKGSVRGEWHGITDRTLEPTYSVTLRQAGVATTIDDLPASGELFELQAEIAEMIACVKGEKSPPLSPYEALDNLKLAMAIQQSGGEGK